MVHSTRQHLRTSILIKRHALPSSDRLLATQKIIKRIHALIPPDKPQCVAAYLAHQGEVDIISWLNKSTHELFLPVVEGEGTMNFYPYRSDDQLQASSIPGLREPRPTSHAVDAENLDIMLLPMIGFNDQLFRLGHGGGYYDRYLQHKRHQDHRKPILIGVAFACQLCQFDAMPWDIPMDAIITEEEIFR